MTDGAAHEHGRAGVAALSLERLLVDIRACRICRDRPDGKPLPHEPRPVLQASATARIAIVGQAPGTRVHASGRPFTDPSGDRLRDWMQVDSAVFYDVDRIAIIPMSFCFPGCDARGSDLPPRRECAIWRPPLFDLLPRIDLLLVVGSYAQAWHLKSRRQENLTATVAAWRDYAGDGDPAMFPLPHPSWRNNAWLKKNPWFAADLLPALRQAVAARL